MGMSATEREVQPLHVHVAIAMMLDVCVLNDISTRGPAYAHAAPLGAETADVNLSESQSPTIAVVARLIN